MHAAIRHYKLNADASAEFNRKVIEGFVPIVSAVKGFVSYRAIEADNGSWTSISVFETRESADESVRLAADFVRQYLRPLIASGPDVIEGTVVVNKT
ncbi:MAG TPA: antibiotic biosynthesis monooxygenase [Polyangiaceae bacterium]|jgi:hypothetical protein|nr:antibiotic biosynthesis monooxygenase [Polyangiaceae bacterium]